MATGHHGLSYPTICVITLGNTRPVRDTARDRVTRTLTEEGCRQYLHIERCRRTEARVFEPKGGINSVVGAGGLEPPTSAL